MKAILYALLYLELVIAICIAIAGSLFVLRTAVQLWFDVDYIEKIKEWVNEKRFAKDKTNKTSMR